MRHDDARPMGVPPAPPGAAALGVGGGGAMRVARPARARQAENAHASRNRRGISGRRASSPANDCTNFKPRSATCSQEVQEGGPLSRRPSCRLSGVRTSLTDFFLKEAAPRNSIDPSLELPSLARGHAGFHPSVQRMCGVVDGCSPPLQRPCAADHPERVLRAQITLGSSCGARMTVCPC